MATVATRAAKRDLAPDWRDALREAVRRFAVRSWGVLLVGLSLGGAVALATHNTNDPSLSTAAGGPPTNWLGAFGAYLSDALLLLYEGTDHAARAARAAFEMRRTLRAIGRPRRPPVP